MYSTISTSKSSMLEDLPLPNLRSFNNKSVLALHGLDIQCNVYEFTLISNTGTSSSLILSQNDNDNIPRGNYSYNKPLTDFHLKSSSSIMNQYFEKSCHAYRFDMKFPDPVAEYRNNANNEYTSKRSSQLRDLVFK